MNSITGVVTVRSLNRVINVNPQSIQNFSMKLRSDRVWRIGIDQSTTCCGICVQDRSKDFQILFDIKRDKNLEKRVYYSDLKNFLRRLVANMQVDLIVWEIPVPSKKSKTAGNVLRELKGHLEEWVEEIPELQEAKQDSLYPQTWKSLVMNPKKGKNRSNIKSEVAADIVDLNPLLQLYYNAYPYSDYDSFDACGILNGYIDYAYTPEGLPMIHGSMEKTHISLVRYYRARRDELGQVLPQIFGDKYSLWFKPELLVYNQRYNRHQNIRMASSNWDVVYTVLPKDQEMVLRWKYNFEPDDDHVLIMFVYRKRSFTAGTIKVIEQALPWGEEVSDI